MPEKTPHEQFMELLGRVLSFGPEVKGDAKPARSTPSIGPVSKERFNPSDPTALLRRKFHEWQGTEKFLPTDLLSLLTLPTHPADFNPASKAAIFAPMTRQSHRAYDAIRRINPDVERNMLRDFKYLPGENPGGAAGKYMFEDPETGEKLMYKFGSQAQVEPGLSGITHTAEHIAGVKKKSAPALQVNMVKTRPDEPNLLVDYMGRPYNAVGSLQRFHPDVTDFFKFQQDQAMRNLRRSGSSPRGRRTHYGIPRQSAEDVMRTGPVEFLTGLTDRKPTNYVIGPDKKLIPVDMGLGLHTPDPYDYGLRLPGESDYSHFAQKNADIPYLREAFRDAARRIVKQGSEPYRPFFPLFESSYYTPESAKYAIEHNLNLLAEPGHVDDMFTSLIAKAFARNTNTYGGSW